MFLDAWKSATHIPGLIHALTTVWSLGALILKEQPPFWRAEVMSQQPHGTRLGSPLSQW